VPQPTAIFKQEEWQSMSEAERGHNVYVMVVLLALNLVRNDPSLFRSWDLNLVPIFRNLSTSSDGAVVTVEDGMVAAAKLLLIGGDKSSTALFCTTLAGESFTMGVQRLLTAAGVEVRAPRECSP
jgi:hypothetical protein